MKKTAIITGTSKGIGRACAELFLEHGWRVLGLSRSPCTLKEVEYRPTNFLGRDWEHGVRKWLTDMLGEDPMQICLVHNAAMMHKDTAMDMDIDAFRNTLELNVVVPTALNKMLKNQLAKGSSIIYIGSTLSEKAVAGTASYVSSKHAVAGLMKATCQDLKGAGVHTACVCPGFTATEMLLTHVGDDPSVRSFFEGMSTFNRLIDPAEIARTVHFCAENPVINGAVLHANLGQVES